MITSYRNFLNESNEIEWSMKDPEFYGITKYKWENGFLDCYQDVEIQDKQLEKLPFKFGKIYGGFDCESNKLMDLEGAPYEVTNFFSCGFIDTLTSLKGGPKIVGSNFYCTNNKLTSFDGGPKEVGGDFYYDRSDTYIESIEDYPMCIIKGGISTDFHFKEICEIVKKHEDLFKPLLDNKEAFHQMVMRIKPDLIKYYTTIQPPTKKSILFN